MASVFTIRQAGKDNGQVQILRIDVTNYVTVTNSCFTFDCPYKHNATTEVVEYKDVVPNGSMSIVANVNCSTFDYIRIAVAGHGTAMFHFQDEFKGENNITDILDVLKVSDKQYHLSMELKDAITIVNGIEQLDISVTFG